MTGHGPQCECDTCDRMYCTCGTCDGCILHAQFVRDTTCACCKWCDDGEDVSDADAVINNNGYCPGCRDAECGEQRVGSPCRAVRA